MITMYPKNGGEPIKCLPQKVKEMESKGWTKMQLKTKPKKEDK